jgi:integrase
VESDGNGGWRRKRGRAPEGSLTEAEAAERMLALVRDHDADQTLMERDAEERRRRGVRFRELAGEYLEWLEYVKGAKPSTLRDHRLLLAEPGQAYRRGKGVSRGLVMAALGERPAREVTTRDIEDLLRAVSSTGVAPRSVNKVRQLVCAIFNYGARPSTYGLGSNPALFADRRREPDRAPLAFYSPEQIEELARSLATGAHRDASRPALSPDEIEARAAEDVQDAELVRVAAYAGLRRGELVALHWRDVDFPGRKIVVRRSLSGDTELRSTKSRRVREVPLADQAAAALDRLSRRGEFTGPDDYVFVNRLGRRLDPSALRRRVERARDAAGLEPLRFHDLRHTYGSLLVAGGIDLASVKAAMGHSRITTTERYLHARPAGELADRFTRALAGSAASESLELAA